jgi:hypothetical protein
MFHGMSLSRIRDWPPSSLLVLILTVSLATVSRIGAADLFGDDATQPSLLVSIAQLRSRIDAIGDRDLSARFDRQFVETLLEAGEIGNAFHFYETTQVQLHDLTTRLAEVAKQLPEELRQPVDVESYTDPQLRDTAMRWNVLVGSSQMNQDQIRELLDAMDDSFTRLDATLDLAASMRKSGNLEQARDLQQHASEELSELSRTDPDDYALGNNDWNLGDLIATKLASELYLSGRKEDGLNLAIQLSDLQRDEFVIEAVCFEVESGNWATSNELIDFFTDQENWIIGYAADEVYLTNEVVAELCRRGRVADAEMVAAQWKRTPLPVAVAYAREGDADRAIATLGERLLHIYAIEIYGIAALASADQDDSETATQFATEGLAIFTRRFQGRRSEFSGRDLGTMVLALCRCANAAARAGDEETALTSLNSALSIASGDRQADDPPFYQPKAHLGAMLAIGSAASESGFDALADQVFEGIAPWLLSPMADKSVGLLERPFSATDIPFIVTLCQHGRLEIAVSFINSLEHVGRQRACAEALAFECTLNGRSIPPTLETEDPTVQVGIDLGILRARTAVVESSRYGWANELIDWKSGTQLAN